MGARTTPVGSHALRTACIIPTDAAGNRTIITRAITVSPDKKKAKRTKR
jgi:hypothetical protein